jgi:hypothetical protein
LKEFSQFFLPDIKPAVPFYRLQLSAVMMKIPHPIGVPPGKGVPMVNTRGLSRLGVLAVGLGVGAAVASSPGIASADSSTDWLSSIDNLLGGLSVPAETPSSGLDIQISIDGTDLFSTTDNTATASSGTGDIAIAIGDGATANASGGSGDFAFADGTDALAGAGGAGSYPGVSGTGNGDVAGGYPGYETGSNDTAIDIGNNNGYSDGPAASGGNFDTDIDVGNNTGTGLGGGAGFSGNHDTSTVIGDNGSAFAGFSGDNDSATVFDPTASASSPGSSAYAEDGNGNIAYVLGDDNLTRAGGIDGDLLGNNDIAAVFGTGSEAISGAGNSFPGDFDLAAAFGDMLHASATNASNLIDILPSP